MQTSPASMTAGLQKDGLLNIPYPPALREAVHTAAESWKVFCTLPAAMKRSFMYQNETKHDGAGYEIKEEKASRKDLKENFHFTRKYASRLQQIGLRGSPEMHEFICTAKDTLASVEDLILDFAAMIELELGIRGFWEEVLVSRDFWILRFLHYFGDRAVGEEIATAHADKSGFTLHLFESAPGLEHLGYDKIWAPMPVGGGETVIIPGMQLQLRSNSQLRALYHRVVATEETARTGRHSMVLFVPLVKTLAYNKAAVGRIQELPVGFNYDMALGEFSKLFA